jgi:predicted butyrate kinase (DUF1464 family)
LYAYNESEVGSITKLNEKSLTELLIPTLNLKGNDLIDLLSIISEILINAVRSLLFEKVFETIVMLSGYNKNLDVMFLEID